MKTFENFVQYKRHKSTVKPASTSNYCLKGPLFLTASITIQGNVL